MWGSIVMKKLMQGPESATEKEKAWGKLLRLDCRFIQVGRTQSPQKASLELHSHWQSPTKPAVGERFTDFSGSQVFARVCQSQ